MATIAFLLVLGAGALTFAVLVGWQSLAVRSWPTATARLVSAEVVRTDTAVGPSRAGRWEPRITYEFTVDGRTVQSHGLYSAQTAMNRDSADAVIAELGATFDVSYNPDDPTEAYVSATSLLWPILAGVVGLVLLLAGVGMLVGGKGGE